MIRALATVSGPRFESWALSTSAMRFSSGSGRNPSLWLCDADTRSPTHLLPVGLVAF